MKDLIREVATTVSSSCVPRTARHGQQGRCGGENATGGDRRVTSRRVSVLFVVLALW